MRIDDTGKLARAISVHVVGHELVLRGDGKPHAAEKLQILVPGKGKGNAGLQNLQRALKGLDVFPDSYELSKKGGDQIILVSLTLFVCLQVELAEGRNRVVRRMFHALGLPLRKLHREAIGPLSCKSLGLKGPGGMTPVPAREALKSSISSLKM